MHDFVTLLTDGYLASRTTSAGVTSHRYSALGELTRVELTDGRVITYVYDGAGRRVAKAIDGQVTERYLWADATRLLATYDATGAMTARYLYAYARTPYAVDTPSGRYFLSFDQVGSLRAVADTSGAVVREVEHDSFGNPISDTAPGLATPLGFAGGLADADTGLVLFGARDYDPALGRWAAKDPIGFAGGDPNLYAYCIGAPVGLVDPAGLCVGPWYLRTRPDAWNWAGEAGGMVFDIATAAMAVETGPGGLIPYIPGAIMDVVVMIYNGRRVPSGEATPMDVIWGIPSLFPGVSTFTFLGDVIGAATERLTGQRLNWYAKECVTEEPCE